MSEAPVCGTGNGNFPQPGDPDLNSPILTARSAFGGIQLHWSYPNVNPEAVAHTLVYRSQSPNEETALYLATVGSSFYFDSANVEVGTTYYYWIKMVSVNATVGDFIGPASATMQPTTEQIIDLLTGQVNESQLTEALRSEIARITDVRSALSSEEQQRLFGDDVLSQLLAGLEENLGQIGTLIEAETLSRITEDSALVAQIELILAKTNDNAAAILQERVVFSNLTSAIALSVETLQATVDQQSASIQTSQQVIAELDGPDGKIAQLEAQYFVKLDVDGYVSGFGQLNDGQTSEFTVLADRFAIAQPALPGDDSDLVVPFVIGEVNGETQIVLNARSLIPDAVITNAMIGDAITSDDYEYQKAGWGIFKRSLAGPYAEFNNIYARGNIEASSIKTGVIEAKHIKGGAITRVYNDRRGGLTTPANGQALAFTIRPTIPINTEGNVICMVDYKGIAVGGDSNIGVKIVRVRPGGQRTTIHSDDISALTSFTAGSATSFSDSNIAPNTYYEFWVTNTWPSGSSTQREIGANMLLSLF